MVFFSINRAVYLKVDGPTSGYGIKVSINGVETCKYILSLLVKGIPVHTGTDYNYNRKIMMLVPHEQVHVHVYVLQQHATSAFLCI